MQQEAGYVFPQPQFAAENLAGMQLSLRHSVETVVL
jgi:hypothetical protein